MICYTKISKKKKFVACGKTHVVQNWYRILAHSLNVEKYTKNWTQMCYVAKKRVNEYKIVLIYDVFSDICEKY